MRKKIYALLFLLVFSLLLGGCGETADAGGNETAVPDDFAYTLLVTINPELKLYLAEDNKILAVDYLNDDAKTAFADSQLVGTALEDGLAQIVEVTIEKGYLTDGKDVTVVLAEVRGDAVKTDQVLAAAQSAIGAVLTEQSVSANVIAKAQSDSAASSDSVASSAGASEQTQDPTSGAAQTSASCPHCGGSGLCADCNGGKMACPACSGTGTEVCANCDENGMQSCPNRRDCVNGKINCQNCQGAGTMTCNACGGTGKDHNDGVSTCTACGGSGQQICPICGGAGYELCPVCNGTGKATCEVCGGKHSFVCTHCGGVGTAMDCPTCHGTFKCIYCGGSGKQK